MARALAALSAVVRHSPGAVAAAGQCAAPSSRGLHPLARRARHLPKVDTRTAATSLSSSSFPLQAVQLEGDSSPWQRLTVYPVLHGRLDGPCGGKEIAAAIRIDAPRQVLVELCVTRYAEALTSAVLGLPAKPPSRIDILGNIHGGLLAHELVPVLVAAREVGAAVVPIDRPQSSTKSRVAQRLWHPRLIQGLLQYGAFSMRRRATAKFPDDATALSMEMERICPAAHQVLIDERCSYLAHQVRAASSRRADVVLVCGALNFAAVVEALRRGPSKELNLPRLAKRSVPVWPLYIVTYAIIPIAVAWWAAVGAWKSLVVPALRSPDDVT